MRDKSERNRAERPMPVTVHASVAVSHNYSTQKLNSTEKAKENVRSILAQVGVILLYQQFSKCCMQTPWGTPDVFRG